VLVAVSTIGEIDKRIALWFKSVVAKHTKVMLEMLGVFKKDISKDEKQEILDIIEEYGNGYVP
jgi:uncharacterized protein YbgA (DUF1722 family)